MKEFTLLKKKSRHAKLPSVSSIQLIDVRLEKLFKKANMWLR
jgi:hypothetical protein